MPTRDRENYRCDVRAEHGEEVSFELGNNLIEKGIYHDHPHEIGWVGLFCLVEPDTSHVRT